MSDLTTDQEALRDEIAQAIAKADVTHAVGSPLLMLEALASAVLPIVTRREAALRERLELAEENTSEGADAAVRQAQTMAFTAQRDLAAVEIERDQLVEKINTLADELDDDRRGALRDTARLVRGLVSGDNQAVRRYVSNLWAEDWNSSEDSAYDSSGDKETQ